MFKYLFFLFLAIIPMLGHAKIEVHGHRGARAVLPENTLVAFDYALKQGVDVLEMDVAVTKDNIAVISHDLYINPIICLAPGGKKVNREIPIRSLTLKQLKKYDCGSLKNPRFKNQTPQPKQRIPTLEEVFKLVKSSSYPAAKKVGFNIESKIIPAKPKLSLSPKKFARLLIKLVKKHNLQDRVVLQSFDHRVLKEVKNIDPKILTSALIEGTLPDMVAMAKAIGANVVSPNINWILKEDIQRLHKAGVKVIPWTANSQQEWERLVDLKVDGIISDDPKSLIEYLIKRKLR